MIRKSIHLTSWACNLLPEPWPNAPQKWKEQKFWGLQTGPHCAAKCGWCREVDWCKEQKLSEAWPLGGQGKLKSLIHGSQILAQHPLSVRYIQLMAKRWSKKSALQKVKNSPLLNCSSSRCNDKTSSCPVRVFSHFFFIKSFLKCFSLYEFQCRYGVQDRTAWIAGNTSCERVPAVVYVVTLFPLTFDAGWHGSAYDWILQGRARGLESLGFISLTCFSPSGLDSTALASGCLHAPLLPSWSISSAFGYHSVSINAGTVTLPNASCLTGSSLHSAFLSLSSHSPASDPALQKEMDTSCCTHQLHSCTSFHSKNVSTLLLDCELLPSTISAPTTAGSSPPPSASQCLGAQHRHLKHHNINKLWVRWREK